MMRFTRRSRRFLSRGEEKDLKKSIRNYEQLVQQEPKNPEYWNSLGDLYMRARERDKALQCYERAFHLYAEDGYTENAIGVGKKILRHDPARAEIHLELAKLYADPDVKNYKASLDEIQRFYQTAQRLTKAELDTVMELLSRMWGDLSSQEDVENLPIAENLFAQTEELIANIAMSGMKEAENPLRQEDLASLEEMYGGETEESRPAGPEVIPAGEVSGPEAPPEEPGMPVIEEEPVEAPAPEDAPPVPRIEEETPAPEAPVLPEEPEPRISGEESPSDGDTEALFSALEESMEASSLEEETSVVEIPEETQVVGAASSSAPEPVVEEAPSPASIPAEEVEEVEETAHAGEAPLDPREFSGFLAEQVPLLGGEIPGTDYLDAGYALLGQGRAEEALQAFATALKSGAPPFAALLGVARACADREDWEGVVEAVNFLDRLDPRSGEDWKALGQAYALRARAHQQLGRTDQALRDARRARILGG